MFVSTFLRTVASYHRFTTGRCRAMNRRGAVLNDISLSCGRGRESERDGLRCEGDHLPADSAYTLVAVMAQLVEGRRRSSSPHPVCGGGMENIDVEAKR